MPATLREKSSGLDRLMAVCQRYSMDGSMSLTLMLAPGWLFAGSGFFQKQNQQFPHPELQ
jgi:hypothetical protein